MKTIISLIFFFLFYLQITVGQVEPRLYQQITYIDDSSQDVFRKSNHTTYEYNNYGNLKEVIYKVYDFQEELLHWRGEFYTYNSENQVIKKTLRRYNQDVNVWITLDWVEYEYDSNGCEISIKKIDNFDGLLYETQYERNANCQLIKETHWAKAPIIDTIELKHIYERTYFQDGISYREVRSEPKVFLNNALVIKTIWDNYFHPDGRQDETYTTFNDNLGEYKYNAKYTYDYDQFDNLISSAIYKQDSIITEWELLYENLFSNEYDDGNRLTKVAKEHFNYTFNPIIHTIGDVNAYKYWCKDLQKVRTRNIGSGFTTYRYESFYEGVDECFEIENELLEIDVFPNPSSGIFTVNSYIFKSGNTQISIFDTAGKLLLEKIETRRREQIDFDFSHLPNGMYIIQLMNQEYFVQDKVLINR